MRFGLRVFALATVVAMVVVIAGCGSSSSSSSSSLAGSTSSSSSSSGLSAETQQAVDTAYKGNFSRPPSSGPKAQAGKNIWVITQSAQATDLTAPGQILDAAKVLGWHVNLVDGKYDPGTWVSGIRQAIAAKADGIILFAIDCAPVKAALQDAKKAGIPIVGWEDVDCDKTVSSGGVVTDTGQPGLFSATLTYPAQGNPDKQVTFVEALATTDAAAQVLGVTAGTKAKAKVIGLDETDCSICLVVSHGWGPELKKYCPGCQIVDSVPFVGTDIGSKLQDKVSQALVQHPDANAVIVPYGAVSPPVAAAVVGSGRKNQIYVMGGEGTAAEGNLIRAGDGLNAAVGYSVAWEGWAAMDAMNRLLNGEKPSGKGFPSGLGFQLFDADHNLPPKDKPYQPPIDFRAIYTKSWGG